DVDDVVDPAHEPVIAVGILLRAVAGEVRLGAVLGEVVGDIALVVFPERPEHPGPWVPHGQETALALRNGAALLVQDRGLDPGERHSRRARLERGQAGERCDEDAAGLRLPPGINDRAALLADDLPVPDPGLRVDRL